MVYVIIEVIVTIPSMKLTSDYKGSFLWGSLKYQASLHI